MPRARGPFRVRAERCVELGRSDLELEAHRTDGPRGYAGLLTEGPPKLASGKIGRPNVSIAKKTQPPGQGWLQIGATSLLAGASRPGGRLRIAIRQVFTYGLFATIPLRQDSCRLNETRPRGRVGRGNERVQRRFSSTNGRANDRPSGDVGGSACGRGGDLTAHSVAMAPWGRYIGERGQEEVQTARCTVRGTASIAVVCRRKSPRRAGSRGGGRAGCVSPARGAPRGGSRALS
jgi:hypothetical protein